MHKKYSHPERVIASRGNNVERRSWEGRSPHSGTNVISFTYTFGQIALHIRYNRVTLQPLIVGF